MYGTHTILLPSLALLLALAVGIHGSRVGIGECNESGGTCVNPNEEFCYKVDQITVPEANQIRECGNSNYGCCKVDTVLPLDQRQCDAETPTKCMKSGGLCQDECDTVSIDGLCEGDSCKCCVQKAEKCKPKKENKDEEGFCVSKRKYCKKAGGEIIGRGCSCHKRGVKAHFCIIKK